MESTKQTLENCLKPLKVQVMTWADFEKERLLAMAGNDDPYKYCKSCGEQYLNSDLIVCRECAVDLESFDFGLETWYKEGKR